MKQFLKSIFLAVLVVLMANPLWAFTITVSNSYKTGRESIRIGTITFDDSYPTGGETIGASNLNLNALRNIAFQPVSGYLFEYDYDNDTVIAYNSSGSPAVSIANESAHTHAVALDSGASGAEAAHTHAVVCTTDSEPQTQAFTKPTIALTHNADPVSNLAAAALYAYEAQGSTGTNQIYLESQTNGNASVLGETADGVAGAAASARFWVQDNDTPNGVQIYLAEDTSDQLEFISPTTSDGYIIMPFEAAGIPGAAVKVTVHHAADADGGKALYFDDNGAADAQLAFVDAGAAGGTIPPADVEVIYPAYSASGVICNDAASAAGSSHTHGYGTLEDAASGTGSAHTHTATATAEAADQIANESSVLDSVSVKFYAVGY